MTLDSEQLDRHKAKNHQDEYNYACTLCDYGTLISHKLKRHMMLVHPHEFIHDKSICVFDKFPQSDRPFRILRRNFGYYTHYKAYL